jgi:hypothetical protein
VRLHPANAAKLYALVESRGVATAKVFITGWDHKSASMIALQSCLARLFIPAD